MDGQGPIARIGPCLDCNIRSAGPSPHIAYALWRGHKVMSADLAPLLKQLADTERLKALAKILGRATPMRLHLAPLLNAARSTLVAALATRLSMPIVYVVSNSDIALRAYDDLCQWLSPDLVALF